MGHRDGLTTDKSRKRAITDIPDLDWTWVEFLAGVPFHPSLDGMEAPEVWRLRVCPGSDACDKGAKASPPARGAQVVRRSASDAASGWVVSKLRSRGPFAWPVASG